MNQEQPNQNRRTHHSRPADYDLFPRLLRELRLAEQDLNQAIANKSISTLWELEERLRRAAYACRVWRFTFTLSDPINKAEGWL